MAIEAQRGESFVFCLPLPIAGRVIAVGCAGSFLFAAAVVLRVCLNEGFKNNLALWCLAIGLAIGIALFSRLAFPPRGAQPSLQFQHDKVRFTPGEIGRLFAEPAVEVAITPQSKELLLCRDFFEELHDGYRVIIRATDGTEREVRAGLLRLDSQKSREIVEGITGSTGLPVRLIIRRRSGNGSVHETPWIPLPAKANIVRGFATATIVAAPYIGGIIVGYLLPRPAVIVAVGLTIWVGQMLGIFAFAYTDRTQTKYSLLYSLTTIFTFGATYGFAVVVVAFVFRARH